MRGHRRRGLQTTFSRSPRGFVEGAGADRQTEGAAHRSTQGLPPTWMRRAVEHEYAGRAQRIGRSNRTADVAWILHVAETQHQRFGALQGVVDGHGPPPGKCDDATRRLHGARGFQHAATAFVDRGTGRLCACGKLARPAIGQQQFETDGSVECFTDEMIAVEQHDARFGASRNAAAALNNGMLTACDTRRGGHEHDDSMLASTADVKEALIRRFEREIADLERELTHDLPKEIQRARELGDLRENAEYHAAKERQRFVEARVSMLKKRVSEIHLMNLDRIPKDRAGFGSRLMIREEGRTFTYELVMPEDSDPEKGLISVASPIGRALVGKEAGDEVDAPTPAGVRSFEILKLTTIHDED